MAAPLELLAFAIGIKPALRLRATPGEIARLRARGAAVEVAGELAYVARDAAWAAALAEAEALVVPGAPNRAPDGVVQRAHREVGRLLGYPPCCVEAFVERVVGGVDVRADGTPAAELVVAAEAALARSTRVLARTSFLLPKREALVPFDPCAFDCEPALRYADALFAAYEARDPIEAAALRARLLEPVRLAADARRLRPDDPEPPALTVAFGAF